MSSATAVPLRPVKKSGLAVLWIGLALLVAASAAWAFWSRPPTIRLETVQAGHGRHPTDSDFAIINYRGRLAATGSEFDAGQQTPLPVGRMVPGFSQGLKRMQAGGKYILHIPASLGYGAQETGPIPANSTTLMPASGPWRTPLMPPARLRPRAAPGRRTRIGPRSRPR